VDLRALVVTRNNVFQSAGSVTVISHYNSVSGNGVHIPRDVMEMNRKYKITDISEITK
jgi:hypothetical protein